MTETERVTFRLTTGQEIFIGFRETPRQKQRPTFRGSFIGQPSERAAREVMSHRLKAAERAHDPYCTCDECIPF